MKHILLTQGKFAIVDDDMYDYLNQWKWCASKARCGNAWYAMRRPHVKMHHQISGKQKGSGGEVDHLNGDGLDNRRENLRICSHSANMQNRHSLGKGKTSKYQGVCWDKHRKRWRAQIGKDEKRITIGRYKNSEDAAKAYDRKALELYGEQAKLNFPKKVK